MGKSVPASPDYTGAAQATAQSNQMMVGQQTYANRPNVFTPNGAITWNQESGVDPATGMPITYWNQNVNLTQPLQAANDAQQYAQQAQSETALGLAQRMQREQQTPVDWSQFQSWGQGADPTAMNERGFNAYMDQAQSRLDPMWQQQERATRTRLYGQGLREGDAAFDQAMQEFGRNRNDAYTSAINQGVQTGAQLGGQLFNQGMQQSQYQNSTRQAQIAESMQRQGWTLNQMQALLNSQQVALPNGPGFTNAGAAQGANYLGAAGMQGNYNMNAYQAQMAQMMGMINGGASLAALPFGF